MQSLNCVHLRCYVVQVVGIPGFVDGKMRNLSRPLMQRMNLAQLQVVVNELHAQIEGNTNMSCFDCQRTTGLDNRKKIIL